MEENGISTVVIASGIFRDQMVAMKLLRTIITHYPLGQPLGSPGHYKTQHQIVTAALDLLENAQKGGVLKDLPAHYDYGCENIG